MQGTGPKDMETKAIAATTQGIQTYQNSNGSRSRERHHAVSKQTHNTTYRNLPEAPARNGTNLRERAGRKSKTYTATEPKKI